MPTNSAPAPSPPPSVLLSFSPPLPCGIMELECALSPNQLKMSITIVHRLNSIVFGFLFLSFSFALRAARMLIFTQHVQLVVGIG